MKTKHIISCVLLCVFLGLTGCVSNKNYKEFETRLTSLEKEVEDLKSGNKDTLATSTSTSANASSNVTNISIKDDNESVVCSYSLDNMSASEIFDELNYYFANLPYEGETYDELKQSLKCEPLSVYSTRTRYSFVSNHDASEGMNYYYRYSDVEQDCIIAIDFRSIEERMDGKIEIGQYPPMVTFLIALKDFEKASSLYDLLYEKLHTKFCLNWGNDWYYSNNKTGTEWTANGVYGDEHGGSCIQYLVLDKGTNGYYYMSVTGR